MFYKKQSEILSLVYRKGILKAHGKGVASFFVENIRDSCLDVVNRIHSNMRYNQFFICREFFLSAKRIKCILSWESYNRLPLIRL